MIPGAAQSAWRGVADVVLAIPVLWALWKETVGAVVPKVLYLLALVTPVNSSHARAAQHLRGQVYQQSWAPRALRHTGASTLRLANVSVRASALCACRLFASRQCCCCSLLSLRYTPLHTELSAHIVWLRSKVSRLHSGCLQVSLLLPKPQNVLYKLTYNFSPFGVPYKHWLVSYRVTHSCWQ